MFYITNCNLRKAIELDKEMKEFKAETEEFETELNEFMSLVKLGGHILDAGCGSGVVAQALVDNGFQVTGIDISQKMIDIARHRTPEADFRVGDMTALEFDTKTFDGIV